MKIVSEHLAAGQKHGQRQNLSDTADLPKTSHAHEEHFDMNIANIVTGLSNHELANATGHETCRWLISIGGQ